MKRVLWNSIGIKMKAEYDCKAAINSSTKKKSFTGVSERMFWKLCDIFTGGEIAIKIGMNYIIVELVSVKSL